MTNATKGVLTGVVNGWLGVAMVFGLLTAEQAGAISLALNSTAIAWIGLTRTWSKKRIPDIPSDDDGSI